MKYYKVRSSHWPMDLEFKSELTLTEGQFFRIKEHDGTRPYPTRFKVIKISDEPEYTGTVVEIKSVDFEVEPF